MSKKEKAFALFDQGKRPSDPEVKSLGLKPKTRYNYYQLWKKLQAGDQLSEAPKPKPVTVVTPKGLKLRLETTDAVSQALFLELVPKVLRITLTPDIFMSYMCALKNGYEGHLADWLSLVSREFWFGRQVDMYAEVSDIKPPEDKQEG